MLYEVGQLLYEVGQLLYEVGQLLYEVGQLLYEIGQLLYEIGQLLYEVGQLLYEVGQLLYDGWTVRRWSGNNTKLGCVHVASRDQDSSEEGMKKCVKHLTRPPWFMASLTLPAWLAGREFAL